MSEENVNSPLPDISGIMDIISKNPELVEKAASILDGMKNDADSPFSGFDPSALGAMLPAFNPTQSGKKEDGGQGHRKGSRSCELLRALKPYLSKERCDAIDHMLNFSKIGDLLGAISPNASKGGKDV